MTVRSGNCARASRLLKCPSCRRSVIVLRDDLPVTHEDNPCLQMQLTTLVSPPAELTAEGTGHQCSDGQHSTSPQKDIWVTMLERGGRPTPDAACPARACGSWHLGKDSSASPGRPHATTGGGRSLQCSGLPDVPSWPPAPSPPADHLCGPCVLFRHHGLHPAPCTPPNLSLAPGIHVGSGLSSELRT